MKPTCALTLHYLLTRPARLSTRPLRHTTLPSSRTRAISTSMLTPVQVSKLSASQPRLLDTIHHTSQWGTGATYGSHPTETGMNRLALSATDKLARDWFVAETQRLGCEVTVDEIGNIFAVRKGLLSRAGKTVPGATFAGSHLDTQPQGGRYDGVLGVCAGIEMLRVLDEKGLETEGDVGVVNWTNEEGARWGVSMMGSGVWVGDRDKEEVWGLKDQLEGEGRGRTVKEELEAIGYLGEHTVGKSGRFPMAAHFEVHIEQGRYLDDAKELAAVVDGVAGYAWLEVQVRGRASHAGTTRKKHRSDALQLAARLIQKVAVVANKNRGLGTVGTLQLTPGSINTVPGEVNFTVDFRNKIKSSLNDMVRAYTQSVQDEVRKDNHASQAHPLSVHIRELFKSQPITFSKEAMKCVEVSALSCMGEDDEAVLDKLVSGKEARKVMKLTSGAGHDSVHASKVCPTAMIFVPCKEGLSHHPKEYASPEACAIGASVLLQSVVRWDRRRREKGDLKNL